MALKRCLAALALSAAVGCKQERPPPPPPGVPVETPRPALPEVAAPSEAAANDESPWAWVIHSGDGNATLRQAPSTPGKCLLECTVGATSAWSARAADCFGEKADRKFVANDCQRTVVMFPAPPRAQAWRTGQVMRVYKKDKLDYPVVGVAVLKDERLIKSSRSWLKGCYGIDGEPPHYSGDGLAVEYSTIDGKAGRVPLTQ